MTLPGRCFGREEDGGQQQLSADRLVAGWPWPSPSGVDLRDIVRVNLRDFVLTWYVEVLTGKYAGFVTLSNTTISLESHLVPTFVELLAFLNHDTSTAGRTNVTKLIIYLEKIVEFRVNLKVRNLSMR